MPKRAPSAGFFLSFLLLTAPCHLQAQRKEGAIDCPDLQGAIRSAVARAHAPGVDDIARGVAREADSLSWSKVALLGRYLRGAEHGMIADEQLGFCLIYGAVQNGYALGAYDVAEKYSDLRDYSNAVKYYGILFGWSYVSEGYQMKAGLLDPLKPYPGMSHSAYAEVQKLRAKGLLSPQEADRSFHDGVLIGLGMSVDIQRRYRAR